MFEFATDDDRKALLELCDNHDNKKDHNDYTLTEMVTSALANSITASPKRFWAVLRRLGHKPIKPLPQVMQASARDSPSSSMAEVSAIWALAI
jgi:transposase